MNIPIDPLGLSITLALLSLVPTLVIVCTSFLKISTVLLMLRNALGVQQIPPNIALYALSLILSAYVMMPVAQRIYDQVAATPEQTRSVDTFFKQVQAASDPLRGFMMRNSEPAQRTFFVATARRLWGPDTPADLKEDNFLVLMPAFMVSELTRSFQIGFLLYLPFLVIDLVVSNILLAMGMMMVSPVMIALPIKLFLFVMLDGWTRLIHGLVLSYV
ncbi:type III secretion system export apparatus subunit SctR [Paraburkholderia agricolaris]|nr:type III secretion system export apparatus subunit SctR [Paraburkholderia agricolaris]